MLIIAERCNMKFWIVYCHVLHVIHDFPNGADMESCEHQFILTGPGIIAINYENFVIIEAVVGSCQFNIKLMILKLL